jgi:membrane protein implicated in regulation of membrane protease activity
VRGFLRHNSLTLAFLAMFVAALIFQALAGWDVANEERDRHGESNVSLGRYVTSSEFGRAVMENWQSEYLQFTLFVLLTVWLIQRGSPESKETEKAGRESDEDQMVGDHARDDSPRWAKVNGLRRKLYENSLLLVMGTIWVGSWLAQSVTGLSEYNAERFSHQQDAVSWPSYVGSSNFWETTLQNWQSEFLAVASMAVLAVYLRQRGSPESKPVGASHDATGVQG